MELFYFLVRDLDLKEKKILDAALGLGRATAYLAGEMEKQGGGGKILAVDEDIPREVEQEVKKRLGSLEKYVELKQADIFDLSFIEDASMDVVNCHDTLVFLNDRPLRVLFALQEFYRVLKPGGYLLITTELPLNPENPQTRGEWERWALLKSIYALLGETVSTEPDSKELKNALEIMGFAVMEEKVFPGKKNENYCLPLQEGRENAEKALEKIQWDELKTPYKSAIEKNYRRVEQEGFLYSPDKLVLKCKKT